MPSQREKYQSVMGKTWRINAQLITAAEPRSKTLWSRMLQRTAVGVKPLGTRYQTPSDPVIPDPVPLQTYVDLWVIRNGTDWVEITEEMLIDQEDTLGRMTRALASADMLVQHYVVSKMMYVAKIKEGV